MKQMRNIAMGAVDKARQLGAAASEVLLQTTRERVRRTDRPPVSRGTSRRVTVRVYDEQGRAGRATGRVRKWETTDDLVAEAIAAAQGQEPDALAGPAMRLEIQGRGLSIDDPRQPRITDEDRAEVLIENEDGCLRGGAAAGGCSFVYRETVRQRAFASSRGVDAIQRSTTFALEGEATAELPELSVRAALSSRHFADIASRPVGALLSQRLRAMGQPVALPSGPLPLVISQRVAAAVVAALAPAFDGRRVRARDSFLANHLGQRRASELFHLIDDATIPGGPRSRSFDGRGVSPVPVPLIREGVVTALYRDVREARALDIRPTGHSRASGELWTGNLLVRPGNRSRNMVFPELGTVCILESLRDAVSLPVSSGRLTLRADVFVADASGVQGYAGVHTLRLKVFELLGAITHMLNDHERHSHVDSPSWVVQGPWFV